MYYIDFKGDALSALGLGTMRLPVLDGKEGAIDEREATRLIDAAFEHGITYFDTAWGYHAGTSEEVVGAALARHDRSTFFLATKFPGYNTANFGHHAEIFEQQLRKCRVEYFDYYLAHNVNEGNIERYLDEQRYHTMDYLLKQQAAGRIRHLGFSVHGRSETFDRFLERYGQHMEFCQVQLNYFDWSFQDAAYKVGRCRELGIPVWVMEPLRGGKLCTLGPEQQALFEREAPGRSPREWAFRWLQSLEGLGVVLSGMSSVAQLEENAALFETREPLSADEMEAAGAVARSMVDSIGVPCTSCRYCTSACPMGLDIPLLLSLYNEQCSHDTGRSFIPGMYLKSLPEDKRASACLGCHACEQLCPQNIGIPDVLASLADMFERDGKDA